MVTFCFVWGLVRQYRGCFECPNAPPSRVACRMEPRVRQHCRAYLQISTVPVMAAGTCCVKTFQPKSQYSREQSGSNRRLRREDPFVPLPSLVPHFATFFLFSVLCTPAAPSSLARMRPSLLPSLLKAVGNFRRIGPVSESSVSSGHSTPFCVMLFALQSARDTPLEMATCTGPCHKICGIKLTKEDPVAPCPSQLCASAPSDRASLPRPGSNAGSRWSKCHRQPDIGGSRRGIQKIVRARTAPRSAGSAGLALAQHLDDTPLQLCPHHFVPRGLLLSTHPLAMPCLIFLFSHSILIFNSSNDTRLVASTPIVDTVSAACAVARALRVPCVCWGSS